MKIHVMAMAVCLALQPVIALGAQTMVQPGPKERDNMTRPRAMPEGSRLVHTFPDGARLYANTRNGDIRKYSAIDQRGRALKVEIVRNPPNGMLIGPNDAIERGKQRADRQRERWSVNLDERIAAGKCVVKVMSIDGGIAFWDMSASGMGCPIKAGRERPPPHVEGMARADPPPPVVKR